MQHDDIVIILAKAKEKIQHIVEPIPPPKIDMSKQEVPGTPGLSPSNHYLITMSTDEVITFCNSNFSGKFLADSTTQKSLEHILPAKSLEPFRKALETCLSSPGICVNGASKFINHKKEHHLIKWEMVAETRPHTGTAIYLVGYDVNEAPSLVNTGNRAQKTMKAIFDSTDNVKFFISPDLKIQLFNKKASLNAEQLHGRKMQVGDNMLDYARDTENNVNQVFLSDFTRATKGETVTTEVEIKYKSKPSLWFRSEYHPIYEDDTLIGISVTVSDITERKNAEENIRLQNEKLRTIAFLHSHHVRQPLSNIMGILSLIKTVGLSADDKYLLQILNLSAGQLDKIIREIVLEAQHIEQNNDFFEASINNLIP